MACRLELGHCLNQGLNQISTLNHKRSTSFLAQHIISVEKNGK
jgi:hypothetical protein